MVSLSMSASRQSICKNVFSYVSLRQEFSNTKLTDSARNRCISQHLPAAIKENELSFGEVDKIFAAHWLDESHVICGTKCNKVNNLYVAVTYNIDKCLFRYMYICMYGHVAEWLKWQHSDHAPRNQILL